MSGLRRICKAFGGMTLRDRKGERRVVWDYAADEPVDEAEMPIGSDRWKTSERVRWAAIEATAEEPR